MSSQQLDKSTQIFGDVDVDVDVDVETNTVTKPQHLGKSIQILGKGSST